METQYFKDYSAALDRDMECKVYGHAGRPVLFIPCQDGRFFDFEDFHMTDAWAPWIESGQVMVFSIDTMDAESWSDKSGDPYWRIRRYEQWIAYITDEIVPFMRAMVNDRNGWSGEAGVLVFGCSLGATHAVNLFLRRPDLFDRVLALSGIYSADYGFDSYVDEVVTPSSTFIIRRRALSAWAVAPGRFRGPRCGWRMFSGRRTSTSGWISGAMTWPTTGTGGTSRWTILCPTCWIKFKFCHKTSKREKEAP